MHCVSTDSTQISMSRTHNDRFLNLMPMGRTGKGVTSFMAYFK
jgi:hypothetical protein